MARQIPEPIGFTGGVNLNRDPRVIRKGQLALAKNAFPIVPGILSKRPGARAVKLAIDGLTKRFFVLSNGNPTGITGVQHIAHIHKWDANPPTPSHILVASSFDKEGASLSNSIVQSLGNFQTSYEPTQFVNYRGRVIAIVPGLEGFWQLVPKQDGSTGYEWIKATFVHAVNAVTGVTAAQTQAVPVMPRVAFQYKQRMIYANFGAGAEHWFVMADDVSATHTNVRDMPLWAIVGNDVLSYNGRHIELAQIEGEKIVAGAEISLASMGAQIDSMGMFLTEKSCIFLTGEILQTSEIGGTTPATQLGTAQANKVNYDCGCVAQATLVKTPYGHIWAGPDDVWLLAGNSPERIGTNIRPALLACPGNEKKYWSAAYANGVYVLSLVTAPAQTEAGDAAGNFNTVIHQQWWLDLQDGPPRTTQDAKWYGPMEIAAEDGNAVVAGPIKSFRDFDGTDKVVGFINSNNILYMVDYTSGRGSLDLVADGVSSALDWQPNTQYGVGSVVRARWDVSGGEGSGRMFVNSPGGTSGNTDPVWPDTDGGTVVDNGITWREITGTSIQLQQRIGAEFQMDVRDRDSGLGDLTHEKILRRIDVDIAAANAVNVNCTVFQNQGDSQQTLGPVSFGGNSLRLGFTELSAVINAGKAESRAFRPVETELLLGRQFQCKYQDSNAYIIDDSNDYFNICFFQDTAGQTEPLNIPCIIQVKLTHGEYATIDTILTALVQALNAEGTPSGSVFPASPWSFTSAYGVTSPYFSRINLTYTSIDASIITIGLILADTDFDTTQGAFISIGAATPTLYAARCKRLANMLGLDTGQANYAVFNPLLLTDTLSNVPADATATQYCVTASPIKIDGVQIVHQKNSVGVALVGATRLEEFKTAPPFIGSNRS